MYVCTMYIYIYIHMYMYHHVSHNFTNNQPKQGFQGWVVFIFVYQPRLDRLDVINSHPPVITIDSWYSTIPSHGWFTIVLPTLSNKIIKK